MLEVRLLGGFRIRRGKTAVTISSRPAQSLFAFLILNAGTAHRREKLAGLLWPESTEQGARDYLRHALWRIRQALHSGRADRYIQADDLTAGFDASADYWLDAAALRNIGENATADELMQVLSAYSGELLPGFYDEWITLEREHLSSVFEQRMTHLLSLLQDERRWPDILEWAERWIKFGQKPEPAYRALMSAHAAQGDMSKVAATYQRCLQSLREFGFEPSEQTRALHERLKAGRDIPETEPRVVSQTGRAAPAKTNLPVPLTSFVGREREIEQLKQLLSSTRLLTLTGSGGIGKTRLAIQTASDLTRSYKDGVWWVELAALVDEALVPRAVAQALGIREGPDQSLTESVQRSIGDKQMLLVLDNCEHLMAGCARLAGDLLSQCPNLRVLMTSREAVGITGETTFHVPALSIPTLANLDQIQHLEQFESIQLFVERAAAARPDLALTQQNAFAVTQICRRLDGIPLAIELAAARVKVLSLDEIATRLDDRFALLIHGSRTAPPLHQTLRALIDWSHDSLSRPERVLFRRLSVFSGGWTLKAAEYVCAGNGLQAAQVLELLSRLVDQSLVLAEEPGGATRYRILETIREYGKEKLQAPGEQDQLRTRHLDFFLQLAEQAEPKLTRPDQKAEYMHLDAEHDNLRSAIEWAMEVDSVRALRLTAALGRYHQVRGYANEGRKGIEQAMERATQAPMEVRAKGLLAIGNLCTDQGDYTRAKESLYEGLTLFRELGDQRGLAASLNILGVVAWSQGDSVSAQSMFEESLGSFRQLGDRRGVANALGNLGNIARVQGDYPRARQYIEEGGALLREVGDKLALATFLNNLGVVAEAQGDYASARLYYQQGVATSDEFGAKYLKAYVLNGLAHVVYLQNDHAAANNYYRESLLVFQEIGEKRGIAYCLEGFAKVALGQGNVKNAAKLLGAADALRQEIGASLEPVERAELDQDTLGARSQLGEALFSAAWTDGRALTLEKAVAFALDETQV